jgi:putative cell wall-binding protein
MLTAPSASVGVYSLSVVADDADDTTATALPLVGTATGSVASTGDRIDVYSIALTAGDRFGLRVTGDATLDADAYLFAPGSADLLASAALAGTIGDAFGKSLVYYVETTGTYYVAVTPVSGAGEYTLGAYSAPWASAPDNDIAGVALPASPYAGSLNDVTDPDDVFAVSLSGGDRYTVSVDAGTGLDADVLLYDPETDTIVTGVPVAGSAGVGDAGTETFVFDIPGSAAAAGYYLDIRARSGGGSYDLTWAIADLPAGAWDDETDALPLTLGDRDASLDVLTDANDLYSVGIAAGQRLTLDLLGPVGADFDIYVYGPGATRVLDTAPIVWSNDSVSSESLVFDCFATGTYYVEVRAFSGSGAYTLSAGLGGTPEFSSAVRLFGADRYKTALAVSAATFAADSCSTVVLATGQDFPDALSASALAGALGSPVLLTRTASLPAGLVAEIDRLGATTVEIIGGTGAVGPEVVAALQKAGFTVVRTFGDNRFTTSAAVARRVSEVTGNPAGLTAFLVNGRDFADANAVSPYAYSQSFPVLLTETGALPAATAAVAQEIGVTHVVIAGGTGVVTPAVDAQMLALDSVTTTYRLGGADRHATAALVAGYAVDMFWGDNAIVGIATGREFADALGGGAAIGAQGGVLLTTEVTALPAATQTYLQDAAPGVIEVRIFGGTGAVTDAVKAAIDKALTLG